MTIKHFGETIKAEVFTEDGATYCHVHHGEHTASLDPIKSDGGAITLDDGTYIQLRDGTLDQIERWACANGY